MKFGTSIQSSQRKNANDFSNPLTFLLVPPSRWYFSFLVTYLDIYWVDCYAILFRHAWSPVEPLAAIPAAGLSFHLSWEISQHLLNRLGENRRTFMVPRWIPIAFSLVPPWDWHLYFTFEWNVLTTRLNVLPWNFVWTFMIPRGWTPFTGDPLTFPVVLSAGKDFSPKLWFITKYLQN